MHSDLSNEGESRRRILIEYAKWTVRTAVNRSPIAKAKCVHELIDRVAFDEVLVGDPISADEFDAWHEQQTTELCRCAESLKPEAAPFPTGWSVKLINVFLKTTAYVGDLGRHGIRDVLHPPLDNGLKDMLKRHFKGRRDMTKKVDFRGIKWITDYSRYKQVIEGCKVVAKEIECRLIEVEQLWRSYDCR